MTAHDPRPSASRPRKLVLRKIADGSYPALAATTSNSTLTPLPMVRPPPRLSSPALPEIIAVDAAAVAAMTPPAPRAAAPVPSFPVRVRTPAPEPAMPPRAPVYPPAMYGHTPARAFVAPIAQPSPPSQGSGRNTVAPVVASLPPPSALFAPPQPRARVPFSPDSKLLAAGGALAATMLALAVGVFLGKGSAHASASAAASQGAYPVIVETRAAVGAAPLAAVDPPPAAAPVPVEKATVALTVDVQQLPVAPRPRVRPWVVATPKGPNAGWTVADTRAPSAQPPATKTPQTAAPAAPAEESEPIANAGPAQPEIPVGAPAAIDPLVQAVREDIREDEAARSR
jgi:hypothetical protein